MPFHIEHNDITKLRVDAVVNAANPTLLGGGGVDGAIHRAAGPELREYCAGLGGCEVGQAVITPGFRLQAPWIIHTVGPVWCGGSRGEAQLLRSCYRNCLALALEKNCQSVAFPLISAGAYGYPKDEALSIAVSEIGAFLLQHEMEITLVVFDRASFRLSEQLLGEIASYIDWTYTGAARPRENLEYHRKIALDSMRRTEAAQAPSCALQEASCCGAPAPSRPKSGKKKASSVSGSLDERLSKLDESFSQMLLRKIDEKGISDAACYKKANVDRKLFSKIRSDVCYRPSKPTAIAFAIALELPLDETRELLMKAGYALSHSNKFDVIIEYFILRGNYDIFQINEALFAFDQSLLGA